MAKGGSVEFLLDECIPKGLAEVLRQLLGLPVTRLLDRFPQGTEDTQWLPTAGLEGLVVITSDKEMNKKKIERKVLKRYHVTAFFLYKGFSSLDRLKQVGFLCWRWDRIVEAAEAASPGDLFIIPERGNIKPY